ncbi:MAG: hypothetical protein H0V40_02650 [Actinobacteria bacterium]|nr:hypothetical protein [Actinomycetota bacterium]
MKLKVMLGMLVALLAVPAMALAGDDSQSDRASAAESCTALRTSMGATLFTQTYGTNGSKANAFGKCVSQHSSKEAANRAQAAKSCASEQADAGFAAAHGGKSFAQAYGNGPKGKNAMQRCMQAKLKESRTEQREDTVKAARSCKAERTSMGESAFKAKWGNRSNAFGKCVSAHSKAKND